MNEKFLKVASGSCSLFLFAEFCLSLQECETKEHWVCGSNGRSYRNHCELHRDACITKTKIYAEHKGPCLGNF